MQSSIYLSFATAESPNFFFPDGPSIISLATVLCTMNSTLGSASPSQSSVTAIEQNDSSSSLQIDEADTDSRNEGKIEETTNIIPVLTPPLPFPSTLFSDVSSEEKCGNEDNVYKLDEIVDQLDPPSEGSETPPPRGQFQLIGPIRPATTFP